MTSARKVVKLIVLGMYIFSTLTIAPQKYIIVPINLFIV